MKIINLEMPYALYEESIGTGVLQRSAQEPFLKVLQELGSRKTMVFGSNTATGAVFRGLIAQNFAGYINSQTIDSGYVADCDALVIATGPAHYLNCLDKIQRVWPSFEGPVILPFQPEKPSGTDCLFQGGEPVPCHYHRLFVRHDGNIYPCCRLLDMESFRIAHVSDPDILEKFLAYDIGQCSCLGWSFRKATASDAGRPRLGTANLEMSLNCQSQCAMCIVRSPFYTREARTYPAANFSGLTRLVKDLHLNSIVVQGGEVMIQEDTLDFLKQLRHDNPGLDMSLITNANLPLDKAEIVASLFDSVMVSFYGFTEATYKTVTTMRLSRCVDFSLRLIERMPGRIKLKLLSTPASFQEIPSFLAWVFSQKGAYPYVADAQSLSYVRYNPAAVKHLDYAKAKETPINDIFWNEMFSRSIKEIQKLLRKHKNSLTTNELGVTFEGEIFKEFGLDQRFTEEFGLKNVLFMQG